jgi:hypothetical protein
VEGVGQVSLMSLCRQDERLSGVRGLGVMRGYVE